MTIALAMCGQALGVVDFDPISASEVDTPGPRTSGFRFNRDGTIDENRNGSYVQIGVWFKGAPKTNVGDNYRVEALSSGKSGTWSSAAAADDTPITMNAGREWNVQQVTTGTKTTSATFEISRLSDATVLDSETCSASAQVL